jgi:hypothetical protein
MELQKINTADIMSIGKAFAESGMFTDIKSAAQAMVKIIAGQEIGIPPFASMSGIHIIQGKPTIGAGLIASSIKGSGKYDYRVVEHSEKICSIELFQGKESLGISTFTIEDAKKAGTKNMDKFPANMLFARAISNGVKWFTPDVFQGPVYVPEEMGAVVTEEVEAEVLPYYDDVIEAINNAADKAELTLLWKALPKEMRAANELIDTFKAKAASYV